MKLAAERLLARLLCRNAARPSPEPIEGAPGVPPRKASSSKVDSAIRRLPSSAFALSIPKAAKARKFIAISATARFARVNREANGSGMNANLACAGSNQVNGLLYDYIAIFTPEIFTGTGSY